MAFGQQQSTSNTFSAPLWEFTALPQTPSWLKGALLLRRGEGKDRDRRGDGKEREGWGWKGRGGAHCLDSMSVDGTLYGLVSCSYSQILDDTMMFPILQR